MWFITENRARKHAPCKLMVFVTTNKLRDRQFSIINSQLSIILRVEDAIIPR
jgi:hypothetical protein